MLQKKIWTLWVNETINKEDAQILRRKAEDIPVPFDDKSRHDIDTVIDSFLERDDAVGLAAPQIGISKRIIVFKNKNFGSKTPIKKNSGEYDILINPRITQLRGDKEKMQEGCLSCPDINVDVIRYTSIKVKAYDELGNKINKRYTGFLARVVQHELDHLDGKLIIDRGTTIYFPKEKEHFFEALFKNEI